MFQGLRNSASIYILDKSEKPKLKIGQVVSVSNPQPRYGYNTFGGETFVEVKARVGDEEIILKELPSALCIADSHGMVVADSREAMCDEVESMMRSSRSVLDSVDYHKGVIEACEVILREINPQFAKDREQEERISGLEERIGNIDTNMGQMMRMLSKALETSKSK